MNHSHGQHRDLKGGTEKKKCMFRCDECLSFDILGDKEPKLDWKIPLAPLLPWNHITRIPASLLDPRGPQESRDQREQREVYPLLLWEPGETCRSSKPFTMKCGSSKSCYSGAGLSLFLQGAAGPWFAHQLLLRLVVVWEKSAERWAHSQIQSAH